MKKAIIRVGCKIAEAVNSRRLWTMNNQVSKLIDYIESDKLFKALYLEWRLYCILKRRNAL